MTITTSHVSCDLCGATNSDNGRRTRREARAQFTRLGGRRMRYADGKVLDMCGLCVEERKRPR